MSPGFHRLLLCNFHALKYIFSPHRCHCMLGYISPFGFSEDWTPMPTGTHSCREVQCHKDFHSFNFSLCRCLQSFSISLRFWNVIWSPSIHSVDGSQQALSSPSLLTKAMILPPLKESRSWKRHVFAIPDYNSEFPSLFLSNDQPGNSSKSVDLSLPSAQ